MRRAVAVSTCLALSVAFFVSPFQHIHPGGDPDHPAEIHAHFYRIAVEPVGHHGLELWDWDDDHDAVWSVDAFALVLNAGLTPFALPSAVNSLFELAMTVAPVEVVEERGHDPPLANRSNPRAPPS